MAGRSLRLVRQLTSGLWLVAEGSRNCAISVRRSKRRIGSSLQDARQTISAIDILPAVGVRLPSYSARQVSN